MRIDFILETQKMTKKGPTRLEQMDFEHFRKQHITAEFIYQCPTQLDVWGYINHAVTGKKYKIEICGDEDRSEIMYTPTWFVLDDMLYKKVCIYEDDGKPYNLFGFGDKYEDRVIVYESNYDD